MSKAKSERLVNLLILLLSSKRFVSKHYIRETIEGYAGLGDEAFNRMFERDKDDLRAIGAPIQTGSNDPDSEDADGYRIVRSEFELPPISFTPEERAVLGVAQSVWQDSVAATETAEAMETLRAAGADPDPDRARTLMAQVPVEPGFDTLRSALAERREVRFGYRGKERRVQPWRLSQRNGRWYLLGWDVEHQEPRHYKLARFDAPPQAVGKPDAYPAPTSEDLASAGTLDPSQGEATVHVALRRGRGADLRRRGVPGEWAGAVPEGFDVVAIRAGWVDGLVGEVCALGDDAVLLAPEDLRQHVVARLRAVAERWS